MLTQITLLSAQVLTFFLLIFISRFRLILPDSACVRTKARNSANEANLVLIQQKIKVRVNGRKSGYFAQSAGPLKNGDRIFYQMK